MRGSTRIRRGLYSPLPPARPVPKNQELRYAHLRVDVALKPDIRPICQAPHLVVRVRLHRHRLQDLGGAIAANEAQDLTRYPQGLTGVATANQLAALPGGLAALAPGDLLGLSGVREGECRDLMQEFFRSRRQA